MYGCDMRLLADFEHWRWSICDELIREIGGGSMTGEEEDDLLEVGGVHWESIEM